MSMPKLIDSTNAGPLPIVRPLCSVLSALSCSLVLLLLNFLAVGALDVLGSTAAPDPVSSADGPTVRESARRSVAERSKTSGVGDSSLSCNNFAASN